MSAMGVDLFESRDALAWKHKQITEAQIERKLRRVSLVEDGIRGVKPNRRVMSSRDAADEPRLKL